MCKLRSTHLRSNRPNRHGGSVPKLQCGGHCSEDLYVTSLPNGATTGAITDKIPWKKTLRDTVILIDDSAAILDNRKKLTKWTDDITDARNWLIRELDAFRGEQYFAGIFDHMQKKSVFNDERGGRLDLVRFRVPSSNR
jgi:hypothetical protein